MSDLYLIGSMIAWHYRQSFRGGSSALCTSAWHKRQAAAMEERHAPKLIPYFVFWLQHRPAGQGRATR